MLEQLQHLSIGLVEVGYFFLAVAAFLAIPGLIVRLGRMETDAEARERRESHSETAHRVDAEATRATVPTSRPAHSGRKAGRTAVTR